MYKLLIKPFLFLFNPEFSHQIATKLLHFFLKIPGVKVMMKKKICYKNQRLERTLFGLKFKNPVGLAAGFDKNALFIDDFTYLGFSFIEIGTVTPKPQMGNQTPRLFRIPKDKGLINRMGFNNDGVEIIVNRLKKRKSTIVIGGNIGKNKETPNEKAVNDYLECFNKLFDVVDYFAINVSSPNTPELRKLQEKESLKVILTALKKQNQQKISQKPILLKISPDLTHHQLDDIVDIIEKLSLDGLIISNTTTDRNNLSTEHKKIVQIGDGGVSGKPVFKRSTDMIKYIRHKNDQLIIIAVGGIMSGEDAAQKILAGANLVQIYTGLIYEGPTIVSKINKTLSKYLDCS